MRTHKLPFFFATGALCLGLLSASACTPFKVKNPPDGFVEVSSSDYLNRYKALDNVGMNIRAFDNFEGGTMEYWAGDLLKKLGEREYTKTAEAKLSSRNGVEGMRYDFDYTPPGSAEEGGEKQPKFYSVGLFVTKEYIVVVELAGDAGLAEAYRKRMATIAGELAVRRR